MPGKSGDGGHLLDGVCAAHARNHGGDQHELAARLGAVPHSAKIVDVGLPFLRRLRRQPLEIADRVFLNELQIDRSPLPLTEVEQGVVPLSTADPAQLFREVGRSEELTSELQSH